MVDAQVVNSLAVSAAAVSKCATDLRLLAHLKEVEEPFEASQVGSSAMAYKRNPMRCERACGLSRFVITVANSPLTTAATQWMERTLDDSANRRLSLPEPFLALDGCLELMINVCSGISVYPEVIRKRLELELPFMATEPLLMAAVANGADRQKAHEAIRKHAQAAANRIKLEGAANDLTERLSTDPLFEGLDVSTMLLDPSAFIGRSPQQVDQFIDEVVEPIRQRYAEALQQGYKARVNV
jgi:adenylosuccinate lyase